MSAGSPEFIERTGGIRWGRKPPRERTVGVRRGGSPPRDGPRGPIRKKEKPREVKKTIRLGFGGFRGPPGKASSERVHRIRVRGCIQTVEITADRTSTTGNNRSSSARQRSSPFKSDAADMRKHGRSAAPSTETPRVRDSDRDRYGSVARRAPKEPNPLALPDIPRLCDEMAVKLVYGIDCWCNRNYKTKSLGGFLCVRPHGP